MQEFGIFSSFNYILVGVGVGIGVSGGGAFVGGDGCGGDSGIFSKGWVLEDIETNITTTTTSKNKHISIQQNKPNKLFVCLSSHPQIYYNIHHNHQHNTCAGDGGSILDGGGCKSGN